jgi:mannose-6-phosphate isomerase-like protein (cupin superfamily)
VENKPKERGPDLSDFQDKMVPDTADVLAPDGSEVRLLCTSKRGSAAHFTLAPGQVSRAIYHQTVDEIWYITAGEGQMWRRGGGRDEMLDLQPGLSLTIPVGTEFQFRNLGEVPMTAVAVTMPPWPGETEAVFVEGRWAARI